MGLYDRYVLPWVLHLGCSSPPIAKQREKVVPKAKGVILEVGMGTGLNIPFYNPALVERVYGLEPAPEMRKRAEPAANRASFPVDFIELPGEEIPLEDDSVDTVVLTFTLCTIPDAMKALKGMKRVLKPDGTLLFCEHGLAPDPGVVRWQNRLNGIWHACAGGCNLNRDIPSLIREAGFKITDLHTLYLPNTPKVAGYNYWGMARIAVS